MLRIKIKAPTGQRARTMAANVSYSCDTIVVGQRGDGIYRIISGKGGWCVFSMDDGSQLLGLFSYGTLTHALYSRQGFVGGTTRRLPTANDQFWVNVRGFPEKSDDWIIEFVD